MMKEYDPDCEVGKCSSNSLGTVYRQLQQQQQQQQQQRQKLKMMARLGAPAD
jgi:hypothetical protein